MPDLTRFRFHFLLPKITSANGATALGVLVLGLILSVWGAFDSYRDFIVRSNTEFGLICEEIKAEISNRLHAHAQLLRSGSSLFAASDSVTRNDWKIFYENGQLTKNLPGIESLCFSMVISKNQLQEHIQTVRKAGFPDYSVRPSGERDLYTSVIYLESFETDNPDFGYDMFSEPLIRPAMELSRDSDFAVLSDKVTLIAEPSKSIDTGIIMFVPVYRKGNPVNTVEERRKAIIGWICSPYRMTSFMSGLLGRWDEDSNSRIHLVIYSDKNLSANSVLFDSQSTYAVKNAGQHSMDIILPLVFNSKVWTLSFSLPEQRFLFGRSKGLIVLILGIIISFLLYSLFLLLINTKIRAREMAEKLTSELKESENRYRTLIEWTPEAVAVHRNGILLYANPAAVKAIGASSLQDLVGRSFLDLVHPDDKKNLVEGIIKVAGGLVEEQNVTRKFIRLDGKVIDVDLQAILINYDGKPAIYATMRDVTDRKQMEDELRKSREQYLSLISCIPVGIYRMRRNVDRSYIFEYVSPVLGEIFGVNENSFLTDPKTAFTSIHPEDIDSLVKLNEQRFIDPKPFDWEGRIFVRGIVKWIRIASSPVIETNGDIIWNGIVAEITDRKQVEVELKIKNEELYEVIKEKDKFFSIIAHDLRSPFNGFLGLTQMMSEELTNLPITDLQKIASSMQTSATNLYSLIENLLNWTSMKQGLIPFHQDMLKLLPVVTESIRAVLEPAKYKGIEIDLAISSELEVCADNNMLQTVIRNLLSNAVKFSAKGGKVSISARELSESTVEVSVKDAGIGMSEAIIGNLFRLNEQVNRKGTNGEPSSGLGLLVCREFIEKLRGRIRVDSIEGEGSVFYFTLPRACE